jgi:hypothetical protein
MILVACLLVGCSKPVQPRPSLPVGWIDFSPANMGFSVYLPKKPAPFPVPNVPKEAKLMKAWQIVGPPMGYRLVNSRGPFTKDLKVELSAYCEKFDRDFCKASGATVNSSKDMEIRSLQGHRTDVTIPGGYTGFIVSVIKGDGIFSLVAVGPPADVNRPELNTCIDSIELK